MKNVTLLVAFLLTAAVTAPLCMAADVSPSSSSEFGKKRTRSLVPKGKHQEATRPAKRQKLNETPGASPLYSQEIDENLISHKADALKMALKGANGKETAEIFSVLEKNFNKNVTDSSSLSEKGQMGVLLGSIISLRSDVLSIEKILGNKKKEGMGVLAAGALSDQLEGFIHILETGEIISGLPRIVLKHINSDDLKAFSLSIKNITDTLHPITKKPVHEIFGSHKKVKA